MEDKGICMSKKKGLTGQWMPVCAVCQYMIYGEKNPPVDDDGCDCRTIKQKRKDEDGRFMCLQERHLRLNYITGDKLPVSCNEWNRNGGCKEFVAIVPEQPTVEVTDNVVTISTAIGSHDGTRLFYTTDLSDPTVSDSVVEYLYPFAIDSDVTVTVVAALANSVSPAISVECKYI